MNSRLPTLAAGLLAAIALGWHLCDRGGTTSASAALEVVQTPTAVLPGTVQGVASCATSSCHGGPRASTSAGWSYAYTIWSGLDKHSRAYEVLFTDRSQRMAKLLGLGDAHRETTCLNCHSMQAVAEHPLPTAILADGVGCESCHGEASRWRTVHTQSEWKALSPNDKAAFGFRNLGNPLARAKACVDCHVGSPGREVNHDLIAAGHPRLTYEFAAYQRNMPLHWNPHGKADAAPDFTAKSWAVGQAISLAAAMELLATRAEHAASPNADSKKTKWPEFAEFDCYACHQDLRREATTSAGRPRWGTWHTPGSLALLTEPTGSQSNRILPSDIEALIQATNVAWPTTEQDPLNALAAEATQTAAKVNAWAEQLNGKKRLDTYEIHRALLSQLEASVEPNWDSAAQTYLGLVALQPSNVKLGNAVGANRDRILSLLRFAPGFDSPHHFDAASVRQDLLRWQDGKRHE